MLQFIESDVYAIVHFTQNLLGESCDASAIIHSNSGSFAFSMF